LTREAFCEQRDLPVSTLYRYVRRYRGQKSESTRSPRFVQVRLPEPVSVGSALAVVLPGGRRIEVSRGFDAGTLQQLISALEQA
jgi:hypothetical protein